jgi:dihydrofolate reductase
MMMSLDGYLAAPTAHFDDEILAFINAETRAYGTEIYGRRMYETMVFWDTFDGADGGSAHETEFGRLWRDLDKLVISTTLKTASSAKTRIMPTFDPDVIRTLKQGSEKAISVSGPTLAAQFIAAGLVDEYAFYIVPAILGTGDPVFANLPARLDLALIDEHRFATGLVFQRYEVSG